MKNLTFSLVLFLIFVAEIFGQPNFNALTVGCDGGSGGQPVLLKLENGVSSLVESGNSDILAAGSAYDMEAIFSKLGTGWNISFTVSGSSVSESIHGIITQRFPNFGILVGRNLDGSLTCADNLDISTRSFGGTFTSVFSDNFNRANGNPGSNYLTLISPGEAKINNNQLCGDVQSVVFYRTNIDADEVKVTWTFTSSNDEGLESYAVSSNITEILLRSVTISGCDGGFNGQCRPTIRNLLTGDISIGTPSSSIVRDTVYTVEAVFESGVKSDLIIKNGSTVVETLTGSDPHTYNTYGFVVGRQGQTCLDNFRVERYDGTNWVSIFFDDFSGGSISSSYKNTFWVTKPTLISGQVCGTTQSALILDQIITDSMVRVSFDFIADSDEGLESYAVAIVDGTVFDPSSANSITLEITLFVLLSLIAIFI